MRFEGRTVLVTGAGRGIGEVMAARFAAEGASVTVADLELPNDTSQTARAVKVDVTDRDQVRQLIAGIEADAGHLDVLVNNAATCSDTPYLQLSDAEWTRDLDVSLKAAFLTSQAALPAMTRYGKGVIVNIASVNGLMYFGNESYSAAKAGLLSLTRSLAVRYGPSGVRCNALVPGTIATSTWSHRIEADPQVLTKAASWYPLGRVGTPDDVASAALFLASDDASWITGVALPVDGGILAGNLQMAHEIVPD
jgi:meso-butanediol dehydrogenase/(S,S)-butanediol dehydrogenase/diacetyl reductase